MGFEAGLVGCIRRLRLFKAIRTNSEISDDHHIRRIETTSPCILCCCTIPHLLLDRRFLVQQIWIWAISPWRDWLFYAPPRPGSFGGYGWFHVLGDHLEA